MKFIVEKSVKQYIHEKGKRISKDGLNAVNVKVLEFLDKLCCVHNGSKKTIDEGLVYFIGIKNSDCSKENHGA
jgi:hypothetical protein